MKKYEFVESSETFYIEVPDEVDAKITEVAEASGITKAELILEILRDCIDRDEKAISSGNVES